MALKNELPNFDTLIFIFDFQYFHYNFTILSFIFIYLLFCYHSYFEMVKA